ncbi:MAG TPA: sugar phosphate isomerase/epimerase [Pyrinomonadaceae bacterium]|nr:sugar phosphate isomerase/epimerase [Pyrinomonadaceae bacterium]
MNNQKLFSRRDIVKSGVLASAAMSLTANSTRAASLMPLAETAPNGDPWHGLKVGVASYTLRKMPLDAAIKAIQRVGLRYVSIKDFHMPMKSTAEERRAVIQKFKDAGITPLSCGNVTMQNDEANVRAAFEYARDAGIPTIVCSPHPDSMPILDRMVKEFDIKLAIHNHGPEDKRFPSPYDAWKAAEKYDQRIGLCIDVGHTARAKVDPAEAIIKCRARLYDLHLKDINSTAPDGKTLEIGRGVLDIKPILQALLKIKYSYLVSFEYEKDENDPLPGLSESVGYTKALLAGMRS